MGKWRCRKTLGPPSAPSLNGPIVIESAETGRIIATMNGFGDDEQERDAVLMASAPELREALSNLVSFAKACNWDKSPTVRHTLIRCAENALAKARGE